MTTLRKTIITLFVAILLTGSGANIVTAQEATPVVTVQSGACPAGERPVEDIGGRTADLLVCELIDALDRTINPCDASCQLKNFVISELIRILIAILSGVE